MGVGGGSLIRCLVNLKRMSAPSTKFESEKQRHPVVVHARNVQQLAVSCIFPFSMLGVMLNSGVTQNLLLAVLLISVQARSIQNQGKLNCFSVDSSDG